MTEEIKVKEADKKEKAIEKALSPILSNNSVDVRMIGKSFSIIGAGNAGQFTFPKEKINIFQALALAGDLGYFTDRTKIKLLRQTQNGTIIKTFNIKNIDIINSEFYFIEPDDVIFLQPLKSKFFGITTLWSAISTTITTISFGAGIYGILTNTGKD